jgi:hypothetical protein
MEKAVLQWSKDEAIVPEMVYLGDTEEVQMYDQIESDISRGELGFGCIVSSRFDLFCSRKYLRGFSDDLAPIGNMCPVREEVASCGVMDPEGLFYPLVVLPHYIVCNTKMLGTANLPGSLADLLDPYWADKVYMGATELPSAKSFLFGMWYKFGDDGLERCVKHWRQLSAPSACRHGLVKDMYAIGLLPGIFTSPGPEDKLLTISPAEGAPVLPSYAAVKKGPESQKIIEFLKSSAASVEFIRFYMEQAHAYPAHPDVELPVFGEMGTDFFFPDWEWISQADMEYFADACSRVQTV